MSAFLELQERCEPWKIEAFFLHPFQPSMEHWSCKKGERCAILASRWGWNIFDSPGFMYKVNKRISEATLGVNEPMWASVAVVRVGNRKRSERGENKTKREGV